MRVDDAQSVRDGRQASVILAPDQRQIAVGRPAESGQTPPRGPFHIEAEMSSFYRSETRRTADGSLPCRRRHRAGDVAGAYLTDGVFLYRVAGFVAGERGGVVELEDCYRLDVVRVPVRALRARRLRVVTPAAG